MHLHEEQQNNAPARDGQFQYYGHEEQQAICFQNVPEDLLTQNTHLHERYVACYSQCVRDAPVHSPRQYHNHAAADGAPHRTHRRREAHLHRRKLPLRQPLGNPQRPSILQEVQAAHSLAQEL